MSNIRKRRLSHAGYARALRGLADCSMTIKAMMEFIGHGATDITARHVLNGFAKFGLAHIGGYLKIANDSGAGFRWAPVFTFGPGYNAPWPGRGEACGGWNRPLRPELMAFLCGVRALMLDEQSMTSLRDESGMGQRGATSFMRAMRQHKLAYVCNHQERDDRGQGWPLFRFGVDKPDVPKKKPKSIRQMRRHHNEVLKRRRAQAIVLRTIVNGSSKRKHSQAAQV